MWLRLECAVQSDCNPLRRRLQAVLITIQSKKMHEVAKRTDPYFSVQSYFLSHLTPYI